LLTGWTEIAFRNEVKSDSKTLGVRLT
jgi:hypothetical protein